MKRFSILLLTIFVALSLGLAACQPAATPAPAEEAKPAEAAGAKAAIWGYELNDPTNALEQARKKALENAKAKAQYIASSYDLTLGESMEIEEPAYPDIEMGPSYGWERPRRMGRMHWMHWMDPFSEMDRFWRDEFIPEGMAEVIAYFRATYLFKS